MGLLGSAMGRALAGAGGAVSSLAAKYIDSDLQNERAKFLADLQFQNTKRTEEYTQSPEVQGRRRDNATQDTLAAAGAKDAAELASLQNQPLNKARSMAKDADAAADTGRKIDSRKRELTELTPVEVEAENAKIKGTTPATVERQGLLAEADAKARAKYREPRQDPTGDLDKKLAAIDKMDFLDPEEKKAAKKALVGLGKQRDPELDTVTVEDTVMGEDGAQRKTVRKEVRRPGQGTPTPSDDPIKAAMDKARAANKPGQGGTGQQPPAEPPASPIMGRPYLRVPTAELNQKLRGRLSGQERQEILLEIDRRKEGDLQ